MTAGYEFWLFDLDGTIVDVEPAYMTEIVHRVGDAIGYSFTDEQAVTLWRAAGGPPEAQLRRWDIDPETFWAAFHEIEDPVTRAESTFLYEDAAPIGELECPVGLVTHCQPYLTEPVLESLDIADWFDVVICCHDDIGWKPDPRPVERAIRRLGLTGDPTRGALAGDTAADVGAAWNAGIDGIHIDRIDPAERGFCVRADARVNALDEVLSIES